MLDRIDQLIINALQGNARLSNKELAAEVELAPSSCLQRVRNLTNNGVLMGFHAQIEPSCVGIKLQVQISIRLRKHSKTEFDSLYKYLLGLQEVLSICITTGTFDLIIHVALKDIDHLRKINIDVLGSRDEIERCETIILVDFKGKTSLPIYLDPL